MSQTPQQRLEDAFGAARSYLHAIRLAAKGLKDDRDMCALDLLAESTEAEISDAQAIIEDLMEGEKC